MKKLLKIVGIVLVGLIALGLIFGGGENQGGTSATPATTAPAEPPAEALKVTASEMAQAYADNEAAGDAKYKDKLLEISGTIEAIDKDIADATVVRLKGKDFHSVMANLAESEEEKALALKKRGKIILKCTGAGEIMGSPVARNCIIL